MIRRRFTPPMAELTAFESAARHESFSRAADELSLSQAAVSRSIRALEERLGVRLFERVRQRVALTREGESYRREIGPLIRRLEESSRRLAVAGAEGETLAVAVLPTFATRWLIPRLPDFLASRPGLTVNLSTRLEPFAFEDAGFDAALHHGRAAWPHGVTQLLRAETMIPVCSPGFRAARRILAEADLAALPLLHQSTRPQAWASWFEQGELPLENAWRGATYDQFEMVAAAATAGLGAALLPGFLVEQELASGRLAVLFPRPLAMDSGYYVVLPDHDVGEAARAFCAWLVERARSEGS